MRAAFPLRAGGMFLGLFGFAFALRLANIGYVLGAGQVRFPSGRDELYHVRKIVYQVVRFPEWLDFDHYVSFPFGAKPVWPPYLDWGIAALVRMLGVTGDALAVERVILWLPPLLGAASVALLAAIGRRQFGTLAGLVAGALLAVSPAHYVHSQLGQVDHQVVVGLGAVVLVGSAMEWLARPRRALPLVVGFLMAIGLAVSPGALLQMLPVQAATLLWILWAGEREAALERTRSAALAHAAAALLVTPACIFAGSFPNLGAYSPLVLSRFQPLWLGAGALGLALAAVLFARTAAGASRAARIGSVAALVALVALVALALLPELHETLAYAGGWFTHREAFLTMVQETQPLFFRAGRFDAAFALHTLGAGLFVFPLAWLWLAARRGLDANERPALSLLLIWSGALFSLVLAQERFANAFAPALALTLGAAIAEAAAIGRRRLSPRGRFAAAAAAVVGVAALLGPSLPLYEQLFAYSRFVMGQERDLVPLGARRRVVVEEAARFLQENSPPTRGFLDAKLRPEYGVLTAWGDGHLVRYRAERPTVQDNFGSFADPRAWELAGDYFHAEDEEEAWRIAQQLGARYTLATVQGSGQRSAPSPASLASRLWRRLGNAEPAGAGAPALARHRLLWVGDLSGRARDLERPAVDRVAIFEIVPGAEVRGRARPGARVDVALELEAGGGRLWYRARSEASAAGEYRIRLPYPTDGPVSREVRAVGAYRVGSGDRNAALAVGDAEVRAGATLRGPDLEEEGA